MASTSLRRIASSPCACEEVPYRVVDRDKATHAVFCSYLMSETSPANRPAPWLQRGISKTLVSDPDDRAGSTGRCSCRSPRGTSLGSELFTLNDAELVKLMKGWSDHRNFARLEQFSPNHGRLLSTWGASRLLRKGRINFGRT